MNRDRKRRMKLGLKNKMIEIASKRQCPNCKRKMAISKIIDGDMIVRYCRYCGWDRGGYASS